MTIIHPLYYLNEIAAASGKHEKVSLIIKLYDKHPVVASHVFQMALSPFNHFKVTDASFVTQNFLGAMPNMYSEERLVDALLRLRVTTLSGEKVPDDFVTKYVHCPLDAELLKRVIEKDLRCGVGITLHNEALKTLPHHSAIFDFKTMLAKPFDAAKLDVMQCNYIQPKLDGVRVIAVVDSDSLSLPDDQTPVAQACHVTFYSRNGKPLPSLDFMKPIVADVITGYQIAVGLPADFQIVLDGEVTSGEDFLSTVSAVKNKSQTADNAVFHVFDIVSKAEFTGEIKAQPYRFRRTKLAALKLVADKYGQHRVVVLEDELLEGSTVQELENSAVNKYSDYQAMGYEGAIVKAGDAIYEPKRSYAWMKMKACETIDVKVLRLEEGTGKYVGMLGAFVVDVDGVEVNVGSGITDDLRKEAWANPNDWIGHMIEVDYHEKTPDGSLRHPRFIKARPDKD